jgi:Tol biopolymer transport system component
LTNHSVYETCQQSDGSPVQDTGHIISPSENLALVTVYCQSGITRFYLENTDGSQFKQLTDFSIESLGGGGNWSPDEKYIVMIIESREGGKADLYLFDIQKILNDPTTKPVQLTTDGAWKFGAVWQPSP